MFLSRLKEPVRVVLFVANKVPLLQNTPAIKKKHPAIEGVCLKSVPQKFQKNCNLFLVIFLSFCGKNANDLLHSSII